ncbi:MAG: Hpt domain-containing protein [Oligoflexia bacterium]|nr:Hpt domain-containing protein [Oligoflexia bacterium]
MHKSDIDQAILGNAYKIFAVELARHLDGARQTFFSNRAFTADDYIRVGAAFHTIKGGAGFFGLSDLAQVAAKLETMLMGAKETLILDVEEVRALVTKVEALAKELPSPQ